ncbi:MAG TPA: response regulator transcription factor [Acidimicrobiia bacterium]|jgi:DNA-binding response OmpR family regulator
MRPGRVLIVEDDEGIGANLQRALANDEIEVQWVRTAAEALAESVNEPPDLMLLDLGLPDADGLDVCQAVLARQPALPIIILTARDAEIDIVVGLDSGAVDYVTKPFRLAELSARVRAHMRRRAERGERFVIGALVVDLGGRVATLDDVDLALRAKEFDLLAALASVAGSAVRREDLMSAIWDEHWYGSTKTLDVTIASLRRKLEAVSPGAVNITTLRGVGYRLERP